MFHDVVSVYTQVVIEPIKVVRSRESRKIAFFFYCSVFERTNGTNEWRERNKERDTVNR